DPASTKTEAGSCQLSGREPFSFSVGMIGEAGKPSSCKAHNSRLQYSMCPTESVGPGIRESGENHSLQLFLHWLELYRLENVGSKRVSEKRARRFAPNAAAVQIEHRHFVQPPYRRAVSAFDIVRENLQLRLRVDARARRKQKIVVALLSVRLLRLRMHVDFSVEHAV